MVRTTTKGITTSSTAEYFSKNLQQVGFSSPTKAVLTTLKEAVDNSLDACEENGIPPDVEVTIERLGTGSMRNTDRIMIRVVDNGPGIPYADVPKVFGEYLASSKFGRGRCSRGQQGIGISAATTWAMQTTATGVRVITKTKGMKKAVSCQVEVDLKKNKGIAKNKTDVEWNRPHGTSVEFVIDGRIQLNGEAGIINFLRSNALVNPHLRLSYKLPDNENVVIDRVSAIVPSIPEATAPHPHTMKLGEFMAHGALFGGSKVREWLKKGFSRMGDNVIQEMIKKPELSKGLFEKTVKELSDKELQTLFTTIQNMEIQAPSTRSVLSVGEESLAKSMLRLGEVDFFAVVSRKPTICDFKPVQVEVAVARLKQKVSDESEDTVQVLRFANRVPLQFDKAGCAIVKGISTVNWKTYGIRQPAGSLPQGPYIVAVSVVSPFIKFKNASKETIEGSDELVEELRRALIQSGQRLSRHLGKERREADLESKIQHIERFAPILVEALCRITDATKAKKETAENGLLKILGRDARAAEKQLSEAEVKLAKHLEEKRRRLGDEIVDSLLGMSGEEPETDVVNEEALEIGGAASGKKGKKGGKKAAKEKSAMKEVVKKAEKKLAREAKEVAEKIATPAKKGKAVKPASKEAEKPISEKESKKKTSEKAAAKTKAPKAKPVAKTKPAKTKPAAKATKAKEKTKPAGKKTPPAAKKHKK